MAREFLGTSKPSMRRSRETIEAFRALAPSAAIAEGVCGLAAAGRLTQSTELRAICTALGLSQASASNVERVLEAGKLVGLFEAASGLAWRATNESLAQELQPLLEGVWLYRENVHQDENLVEVVLTKPAKPSAMAEQMERTLQGSWGLRDTRELLPIIAEQSRQVFAIVTPFLDEVGASVVANLFERAPARDRFLVLRADTAGAPPGGLASIRSRIEALGVDVRNFRLERPGGAGFETFHAKVVLADDDAAYLGSANMLQWSFTYSLELGCYIRGKAVSRVADVVRAIRTVSTPMITG